MALGLGSFLSVAPHTFVWFGAAFMRQRDFLSGKYGELKSPLYLP